MENKNEEELGYFYMFALTEEEWLEIKQKEYFENTAYFQLVNNHNKIDNNAKQNNITEGRTHRTNEFFSF